MPRRQVGAPGKATYEKHLTVRLEACQKIRRHQPHGDVKQVAAIRFHLVNQDQIEGMIPRRQRLVEVTEGKGEPGEPAMRRLDGRRPVIDAGNVERTLPEVIDDLGLSAADDQDPTAEGNVAVDEELMP
jgi:hypothetical protein